MKRNSALVLMVTLFLTVSCSDGKKESGLQDLVDETVRKMLVVPESYEALSMDLDSAYAPLDDPKLYDMVVKLYQEDDAIDDASKDMKAALRRMGQWSDGESDSYSRRRVAPALEDHDSAYAEWQDHIENVNALSEDILKELKKKPRLIGIMARCLFRAKDSLGVANEGRLDLLLDTTLTKVIRVYDVRGTEYQLVKSYIDARIAEE